MTTIETEQRMQLRILELEAEVRGLRKHAGHTLRCLEPEAYAALLVKQIEMLAFPQRWIASMPTTQTTTEFVEEYRQAEANGLLNTNPTSAQVFAAQVAQSQRESMLTFDVALKEFEGWMERINENTKKRLKIQDTQSFPSTYTPTPNVDNEQSPPYATCDICGRPGVGTGGEVGDVHLPRVYFYRCDPCDNEWEFVDA